MTQAVVGKWGSSLGVRLPADVARSFGLEAGSEVEIVAGDDGIVVRPVIRKATADDLFRGKTPEEWRDLYRDAIVDWGPDVGREIIEE